MLLNKRGFSFKLSSLVLIIFFSIQLCSCKKELTSGDSSLFNYALIPNVELIEIAKDIEADTCHNLGKTLILQNGNPLWDKAISIVLASSNQTIAKKLNSIRINTGKNEPESDKQWIIPFTKDNKKVHSVLIAEKHNGNLRYNLISENSIKKYKYKSTQERINKQVILFAKISNLVYGQLNFPSLRIGDFNLDIHKIQNIDGKYHKGEMGNGNLFLKLQSETTNNVAPNDAVYSEFCVSSNRNCYCPPSYTSCDMCGGCLVTDCIGYWVYNETLLPAGGGGGGSSSSGGGGGTSEIIPDPFVLGDFNDADNTFRDDDTPITFDANSDPWLTIGLVIPISKFVLYDYRNCLDLARDQIGMANVTDLGYGSAFKTYTEQAGVNSTEAKNGVDYIISKLKAGKPVMVAVDNRPGTPSSLNSDNSTDHFVTIVGSGQDAGGIFFRFFDNATNNQTKGASPNNKLYYNSSTGMISGHSDANGQPPAYHDYMVTQIRKNK
ncbi:MAG: hypothetical protein Q8K66_05660 [Sediminibacterium sp.]|nr:hypothetical protein [Sediminibacterium sp.]MDP3129136.1 hypothetical protein [Sediminibacterium sp.]